jgi:hypothetical protein
MLEHVAGGGVGVETSRGGWKHVVGVENAWWVSKTHGWKWSGGGNE